ncbi:response regulator [Novispirillum sp. DQ9]|uniref:response regulator n=1 Tax=Novispirillum sp. DQ9 TaxID=3398612 RepID=UPI003C7C7BAF
MPEQPTGTLLIVDDEPSNIQILFAALKGQAQARFATNGEQALALARQHRPDVVLLDIHMPGMDGFAVLKALRADPATAGCMVVIVSGSADDDLIARAMAGGADDFLVKPCPPPLLQRRVALLLELVKHRRAAAASTTTVEPPPERTGRQRVLVVEDGEINRVILWEMLRAHDHDVTMAVSGEEGLQLLADHAFDTVLLDIHLPGLDGLEVVRRLRASEGAKDSPGPRRWVVAVTGDVAGDAAAQYVAAGFDAVVRKPVDPAALEAALRRRPVAPDSAPLVAEAPLPSLLVDHDRVVILLRTYAGPRLSALFGLFERETAGYLTSMRAALDTGDLAQVAAVAHRLKSALGHFACMRAAAVADRIAHGGAPIRERMAADVAALEALLPETRRALRGALDLAG